MHESLDGNKRLSCERASGTNVSNWHNSQAPPAGAGGRLPRVRRTRGGPGGSRLAVGPSLVGGARAADRSRSVRRRPEPMQLPSPAEYKALLRLDFAAFIHRCFLEAAAALAHVE